MTIDLRIFIPVIIIIVLLALARLLWVVAGAEVVAVLSLLFSLPIGIGLMIIGISDDGSDWKVTIGKKKDVGNDD